MDEIKRVVGKNLLILLAYTLLIRLLTWGNSFEIALNSAIFILVHVIANISKGIRYRGEENKKEANAFFLSSGVVLLVGLSSCLANASI